MREKDKMKPNNVSYMLYFQACVILKSFEQGKAMHEELKKKVSTYMKNKVRFITNELSIELPCVLICQEHEQMTGILIVILHVSLQTLIDRSVCQGL
jgi:hypothetical protein